MLVAYAFSLLSATTQQLRKIWADKGLPRELKAELYTSLCSSVALYNSECWVPHEHDLKVLRNFQMQTLKTVTGERREWQRQQERQEEQNAEGGPVDEEAEYTSRIELCKRAGILDIETMLQEKRVAWVAHAFRDTTEASGWWIANEIKAKTPWGRLVEQDLQHFGFDAAQMAQQPPDAAAVKEAMRQKRKVDTSRRNRPKQTRTATEKTEKMREEQRKRIQQQQEAERGRAELIQTISGKSWVRLPGQRREVWRLEESDQVVFEADNTDFCENTGREIVYVCGVSFYKGQDNTWHAE
ncbi:unnamed protein product [Amoebophrya sp. A120]|nr:unnamed protein product [Amoebophrya sp. A120]|eukprot:GSA120T00011697001.1